MEKGPAKLFDTNGSHKIAYLGPQASYTHSAALQTFSSTDTAELIPTPTIPSVFTVVQSQTTHYGVVPLENSTNGPVVTTLDLFADTRATNPSVRICGEAFVRVRHCLLGRKSLYDAQGQGGIKTLYSHPQAWTQCTQFLSKFGHAEKIDTSSTSKAAEIVAADGSGASAAVSSKAAASLFDLDVLVEGIEDDESNTTRFLVVTNKAHLDGSWCEKLKEQSVRGAVVKTMVAFTVKHDDPGALARALGVFGRHGVNLTSINARPSGERAWHYLFFVEFVGVFVPRGEIQSDEGDGKGSGSHVGMAMEELEGCVERWKWCGCWKAGE